MARIATIVLSVAVTLVVPAILAVNGIRLVTNERYVEAVYDYGGVPDDRYGLGSATRERLALVGLESIQPSSEGISLLRQARLPNGDAAFNGRELAHMEDVRTAVSRAYRFQLIAVAAIGVLAVLFALLGSSLRALVPVALARGAVLTVVVAVVVGVARVHELQRVRGALSLGVLRGRDVALRGDGHAPPAVPRSLLARHGSRHRRAVHAAGDPAVRRRALLGPPRRCSPPAADAGANGGDMTSRAVDRFLAVSRARLAPRTVESYRRDLDDFETWLGVDAAALRGRRSSGTSRS